jgi:hypothetical protein
MNGLMTTLNCAESKTPDVFCKRLMAALAELKVRLQAQYEDRFPGEKSRIQKAIEEAEVAAWRTRFPHLFLPDLAEEAIARGAMPLNSDSREKSRFFRSVAELSKAQGSAKSKSLTQCNGNRFLATVFWLAPQVCFLPCCPAFPSLR